MPWVELWLQQSGRMRRKPVQDLHFVTVHGRLAPLLSPCSGHVLTISYQRGGPPALPICRD